MQEQAENNYSFFEKRGLPEHLSDAVKASLVRHLIPLRHVEHTANLNNVYGCAIGFGTSITQALLFNGMDRLGIAQYLSRIGLILDGNSGDLLTQAKQLWMQDPIWQGMQYMRDMMEGKIIFQKYDNDRYSNISWTSVKDFLISEKINII